MPNSTANRPTARMAPKEFDSGAYQLVMRATRRLKLSVGALGEQVFETGVYIYTGRASVRLNRRIERHLRSNKRARWHADYLVSRLEIVEVRIFPFRAEDECVINRTAAAGYGAEFPVRGFGSSDCRCLSHLAWIRDAVRMPALSGAARILVENGTRFAIMERDGAPFDRAQCMDGHSCGAIP